MSSRRGPQSGIDIDREMSRLSIDINPKHKKWRSGLRSGRPRGHPDPIPPEKIDDICNDKDLCINLVDMLDNTVYKWNLLKHAENRVARLKIQLKNAEKEEDEAKNVFIAEMKKQVKFKLVIDQETLI